MTPLIIPKEKIEEIADAIRIKAKTNDFMTIAGMIAAIENLSNIPDDDVKINLINVSNTDNTSIIDFALEDGTNQTVTIVYGPDGTPAGIMLNDDFIGVEWAVE